MILAASSMEVMLFGEVNELLELKKEGKDSEFMEATQTPCVSCK